MTREDITRVIARVPTLTVQGLGLSDCAPPIRPEVRADRLKAEQERLLDLADECTAACGWLGKLEKQEKINHKHTSYSLKHLAEPETDYVTNGAFIAAAIHMGFRFTTDDLNPCFNISERSLKGMPQTV